MSQVKRMLRTSLVGFATAVAVACGTSPSAPTVAQIPNNTAPAPPAPTTPATSANPALFPTIVMTNSPAVFRAAVEGHITLQVSDVAHDAASLDFGDGTPQAALGDALSADLVHVYASPGTYTIRATVTANPGTVRGTLTVQVIP